MDLHSIFRITVCFFLKSTAAVFLSLHTVRVFPFFKILGCPGFFFCRHAAVQLDLFTKYKSEERLDCEKIRTLLTRVRVFELHYRPLPPPL